MKKKVLSLLTALLFFSSAMWATDPDYLSFTATNTGGSGIEFYMKSTGSPDALNLEYSKDNKATWQVVPTAKCTIPCGTTFYVRTKSTEHVATTIGSKDPDNYWAFCIKPLKNADTVVVSGNIMSLLDQTCQSTTLEKDYVFVSLFTGNTSTTGGMKIGDLQLPATTLSKGCYQNMFYKQRTIKSGSLPALPATTLAEDCYRDMFSNINGLEIAIPAKYLPATNLAKGCYWGMFRSGSKFTSAPELPATTLAESCYREMFWFCSGITITPELPATTLAESCYRGMFGNCASERTLLATLPATELAPYCYDSMFYMNNHMTSIPKNYLPATVMKEGCYKHMFASCSVTQLPELPAMTLAKNCYNNMFYNCAAVGLKNDSIDLPATELVEGCYSNMFNTCYYPTISVHFTSWGDGSYTTEWLSSYYGKFYGPQALIDDLDRKGRSTSTYPSPALFGSALAGGNLYVLPDIFVLSDNVDNTYVLSKALDKVQNIQLRRTFQAGMWNTVCLPFALDASQIATAFGAGTQVGSMTRGETVEDELFLDFSTNVTAMEAGQPYIIYPGANANVVNPTFEGVTITTVDAGTHQSTTGDVIFTGVFSPVSNLKETDYYLGVNNTIHPTTSGTLKGFRAYFNYFSQAGSDAPKRVRMSINGTETTTAMDEMEVLNPAEKMIENGQVVIIKNGAKYNVFGQQL